MVILLTLFHFLTRDAHFMYLSMSHSWQETHDPNCNMTFPRLFEYLRLFSNPWSLLSVSPNIIVTRTKPVTHRPVKYPQTTLISLMLTLNFFPSLTHVSRLPYLFILYSGQKSYHLHYNIRQKTHHSLYTFLVAFNPQVSLPLRNPCHLFLGGWNTKYLFS